MYITLDTEIRLHCKVGVPTRAKPDALRLETCLCLFNACSFFVCFMFSSEYFHSVPRRSYTRNGSYRTRAGRARTYTDMSYRSYNDAPSYPSNNVPTHPSHGGIRLGNSLYGRFMPGADLGPREWHDDYQGPNSGRLQGHGCYGGQGRQQRLRRELRDEPRLLEGRQSQRLLSQGDERMFMMCFSIFENLCCAF